MVIQNNFLEECESDLNLKEGVLFFEKIVSVFEVIMVNVNNVLMFEGIMQEGSDVDIVFVFSLLIVLGLNLMVDFGEEEFMGINFV